MEEQVGMMAYNDKYRQSVEGDDLYQDSVVSHVPKALAEEADEEDEDAGREQYKILNPASTTSSLQQVERASIEETMQDTDGL